MSTISIQPVSVSDAEALLNIYRPYVEETPISFEVTAPTLEEFRQRIETITQRYPYLKAVQDGEIVGYVYVAPFKPREAYQWSVETSIYVRQGIHSHGIGTRLYAALEAILPHQNVFNLNACCAYPHPESIIFHEHHGYHQVAHFTKCGYKLGAWRDMVWLEKLLPRPEVPQPFIPVTEIDLAGILAAFEGESHEA